jgi:membrane fusion protein, multidrug efflux system
MYRKILSVVALALLFSCQQATDKESVRKQISDYKLQIEDLNRKVEALEKQLAEDPSYTDAATKVLVEVDQLAFTQFRHYIEVGGVVEAVSEAYISPEMSGQISKFYVNEGDRVSKGQILARLNSDITQSQIQDVQNSLDYANVVYEKQKRLWDQKIGSEIQYLNARNNVESLENKLKTLNAQLEMTQVTSPVNGIVDEIYVKEGELGMPGVRMMLIVNLDQVYVNADVSESYLSSVKEGEKVDVTFPAYPDMKLEVPIHRKGNVINPNNRTFTVQLKLANPDKLLKPNILSRIFINDFSTDTALVVPSVLVKQDLKGYYVYVVEENGGNPVAKKAYVQTGLSYDNKTMVTEGVKAGQKVIVTGYNQVSDGTAVQIQSKDVS